MVAQPAHALEQSIRARCDAGDFDGAATEAIRKYGAEVFGFLLALHQGHEDAASDVFSIFSEQLWQSLGTFAWQCSLRTWSYTIARNASHTYRRGARRWAQRKVGLSDCSELANMAAQVRTDTLSYLRTEKRSEIEKLRESLPEQDQMLLILRVDRDLAWMDLARIFLGQDDASAADLQRESARLRKRFQLIKERLIALGRQKGLLEE